MIANPLGAGNSMVVIVGALLILLAVSYLIHLIIQNTNRKLMSNDPKAAAVSSGINWHSLTMRSILVGLLAMIMLIPLSMVGNIVSDRNHLYQSVLSDIASTWGQEQTVLAPVLVIPYTDRTLKQETVTEKAGKTQTIDKVFYSKRTAKFLPEKLEINASLGEQFRKRGIYNSLVYTADVNVEGRFATPDVHALSENIEKIHWDKAYITIGLSDTRAINSVSSLNWDGQEQTLAPGTQLPVLQQGFHAALSNFTADGQHTLKLSMSINGSNSFMFAPFGEKTTVNIQSSWPHPSFHGSVLPAQHTISDDGFSAHWEVPHLARNYPQQWSHDDGFVVMQDYLPAGIDRVKARPQHQVRPGNNQLNLYEFTAGVRMFEPVSLYSQITRSVKYGILFIGLTFLTFLIFELTVKARLHYVQYGLIGIALSLFFLVLLSLSEHMQFLKSYIVAAATTIGMITLYTMATLKDVKRTAVIFVLLSSLYIVLYSLLQLEDYALLMGTLLLLLVVMVLMFITRNLQWAE